jgi:hypothetical protein
MTTQRRRWTSRTTILLLTVLVGGTGGAIVQLGTPVALAAYGVSGTVYRDYNGDGVRGLYEPGVGSVTVLAYDESGVEVATATSSADAATLGQYTLNVPGDGPVRVEFTALPGGIFSSAAGAGSGTSVQFVSGAASGVDFAINAPGDYCQSNPELVTSCYSFGDQTSGRETFISFPYESGTTSQTDEAGVADPEDHALALTDTQTGTTWGAGYQRQTRSIFLGAFTKRHAGYGPGGIGAIYRVDRNSGTVSTFLDFATLFPGSVGENPHEVDATEPSGFDYFIDETAWDGIGKTAFADLEVTSDGSALYVVALGDRTLYRVPLAGTPPLAPDASAITPIAFPVPADCPADATPADARNDNLVPGALATVGDTLYVGLTCTAESTGAADDLRAYVYAFDGATFTQVANVPLNYPRGCVSRIGADCAAAEWNAWETEISGTEFAPFDQVVYPQPWLTDIEFDERGFMILGLSDRYGHQTGNNRLDLGPTNGVAAGDMLRLEPTGATWTVENNGTSGGVTSGGAGSGAGPGGGEFYFDERYRLSGGTNHDEIAVGGLVLVKGYGEVATSAFDPPPVGDGFRTGGIIWLSNFVETPPYAPGERTRSYQVFANDLPGTFGKAAGIGDIEALCDDPPIEIGNRVWRDTNGNGVQDPGEPPLAGVTVHLYDADNTLIGTAVTDAEGSYYFSNAPGTSTGSTIYGLGGFGPDLIANTADDTPGLKPSDGAVTNTYTVRLDNPADVAPGGPLAGLTPAPDNSTAPGASERSDSDAQQLENPPGSPPGSWPVATLTTGPSGDNNHTLDFGFSEPVSLGNRIWRDENNNSIQDAGEPSVPDVRVELFRDENCDAALDPGEQTPVAVDTTDAGGLYLFDSLTDLAGNPLAEMPPGCYIVGVPASNFAPGAPLAGTVSSGSSLGATGPVELTPPSPDDEPSDLDDNCAMMPSGTFYAGGALGALTTLVVGDEPTGENPSNDPNTPDASANLTVDCGFYGMSLGNLVWLDADNSGTREAAEQGLDGITVRLYADPNGDCVPEGAPLAEQPTSNGGHYLFTGLVSGTYLVEVVPPPGFSSSTGTPGSAAGPYEPGIPESNNVADDSQDHGTAVDQLIRACAVVLTPAAEPQAEPDTATPTGVTNPAPDPSSQLTVDFGLFAAGGVTLSLGNEIWIDADNNGLRDASEQPVPDGIAVQLFADGNNDGDLLDAGEDAVRATSTTAGGLYLFANLLPGTYVVGLDPASFAPGGPLAGFTSSTGTPGSAAGPYEPAPDADANLADGDDNCSVAGTLGVAGGTIRSAPVTLAVGEEPSGESPDNDPATPDTNENLTVDCGLFQPASLGDFVWRDTNGNGQQDPAEPGVNGVTATLLRTTPNGPQVVATTTTALNNGRDGFYQFTNLPPGEYSVVFSDLPPGTSFTTPDSGDDAGDSDANPLNGTTGNYTLAPGDSVQTVDAGLVEVPLPARLGDFVWLDGNRNGLQDPGEPGVPGVAVELYRVDTGTPVFVVSATTTLSGSYLFDNLPPGDYQVGFLPPPAYRFTTPNTGGDDSLDSDADPTSGRTPTVSLATGQQNLSLDAGLVVDTLALGNCVWADLDNDGRQEAGEPPVVGATVKLFAADGITELPVGPDGVLGTADDAPGGMTTAGGNGCYLFRSLQPGDYVVELTPPAGYRSSTGAPSLTEGPFEGAATPDPDDDADLDDNGTTQGTVVRAKPVTLSLGGEPTNDAPASPNPDAVTPNANSNLTVDFGLIQLGSLGNLVWNDVNNNGRADAGEPGIDGVTVNLYVDRNGNGTPEVAELLATRSTAGGGRYLFAELPPGSYIVELPATNFASGGPLVGLSSSTGRATSATTPSGPYEPAPSPDNNVDGDDNGTLQGGRVLATPITLTPGGEPTDDGDSDPASNLTVDFGLFRPASVGLLVWEDRDRDGVRDPGEPGVPGVRVTLYAGDSTTPLGSTTTGPDGSFSFGNLPPGSYSLGFGNLPQGYSFTSQNQGANDGADSDVNPATGRTQPITLAPGENNLTLAAGLRATTTAIVLSSFTAAGVGGSVVVRWTTVQEINTFGFHLYRSATGERADAIRVTPQLVLAQGRGQGGAGYAFVDDGANPGVAYSYWLEETEVGGLTLEYGPARSTPASSGGMHAVMFLPLAQR